MDNFEIIDFFLSGLFSVLVFGMLYNKDYYYHKLRREYEKIEKENEELARVNEEIEEENNEIKETQQWLKYSLNKLKN